MAEGVPKHVVRKVERMNRIMQQLVDLNFELEEWLEANGVEDAYDLTFDYRDVRGYGIHWPDRFLDQVRRETGR